MKIQKHKPRYRYNRFSGYGHFINENSFVKNIKDHFVFDDLFKISMILSFTQLGSFSVQCLLSSKHRVEGVDETTQEITREYVSKIAREYVSKEESRHHQIQEQLKKWKIGYNFVPNPNLAQLAKQLT